MSWKRSESRASLEAQDRFDVVVVGGGIIGAGTALDLAVRGLSVALLERDDFSCGTSSRSTKLLHGGIRYLPHYEFGLVREGLLEQRVLEEVADYLFEPLDFVIPVFEGRRLADIPNWASHPAVAPWMLRAGLLLYDVLGRRPGRAYRKLDASEVLELVPGLRPEGLQSGFRYPDAQTDDARLTLAVLKAAVDQYGAVAVNHLGVDSVEPTASGWRVTATDRLSGEPLQLDAGAVVLATGAFDPPANNKAMGIVRSSGAHLLVNPAELGMGSSAVVLPETDDGRVLFVVPWRGMAMVGTTDLHYHDDPAHPRASEAEIHYLTDHTRRYFAVDHIEPVSWFSGLRALVAGDATSTARASREHKVAELEAGLVQVAGGKLTTYRRIAAEAADMAAAALGSTRESTTESIPIFGAGSGSREGIAPRLRTLGLDNGYADRLYRRYGGAADRVVTILEGDPGARTPLGDGVTLGELSYAVTEECAVSIADFALRRTHLAWFEGDHGRKAATVIAEHLAGMHGWSDDLKAAELNAFEEELVAEGL